jgi:hypothetical protein
MLVASGLILGAQVAVAQEPGPPIGRLVPIPSSYDVEKAELVKTDNVIFLLTKDVYQREIYKVSTTPQPQFKYAVKESHRVTRDAYIPGWYEVEPMSPAPSYGWKYSTDHK